MQQKKSRAPCTLQSTFWRTWRNPRALGKEPGLGPGVGSPSRHIGSGVGDGDGIGLRQVETYHPSGTNIGDLVLAAVMASVTVLEPEGAERELREPGLGNGVPAPAAGGVGRAGPQWACCSGGGSGGHPRGPSRVAREELPEGGTVGGSGRLAGGRNGRCPRSGHLPQPAQPPGYGEWSALQPLRRNPEVILVGPSFNPQCSKRYNQPISAVFGPFRPFSVQFRCFFYRSCPFPTHSINLHYNLQLILRI